jgi:transcriptional regulator with XRE-family HTH domain
LSIITRAMGGNVRDPQMSAAAIWRAYQEIGRFQFVLTPLPDITVFDQKIPLSNIGFQAKLLATAGLQMVDLMVVFVMGAIGSLIFITQYQLHEAIQGRPLEMGYGRSFAWYVFRPLFGIVMAFALYLLYKAGQIALGSGDDGALSSDVNLPILSILSLFAGLLSWQALDMIQERGRRFFKNAKNADMWATGLGNAMQLTQVGTADLAGHLGVEEVQVRRWVELVDRVNAEMQDRIASFLDFSVVQLFNAFLPEDSINCRTAKGLSARMNEMGITAKQLAAELRVNDKLVEQWARGERCVASVYHRRLLDALATSTGLLFGEDEPKAWAKAGAASGVDDASVSDASGATAVDTIDDQDPLGDDFDPGDPDAPARWAVGLRKALLAHSDPSSALLADALGIAPEQVRAWMELEEAVPADFQNALLAELPSTEPMFAAEKPDDLIVIAEPETVTEALSEDVAFADVPSGERLPHLAELMDVDVDKVDGWMQRREPMPPATAERLRDLLAGAIDDDVLAPADHPPTDPSME